METRVNISPSKESSPSHQSPQKSSASLYYDKLHMHGLPEEDELVPHTSQSESEVLPQRSEYQRPKTEVLKLPRIPITPRLSRSYSEIMSARLSTARASVSRSDTVPAEEYPVPVIRDLKPQPKKHHRPYRSPTSFDEDFARVLTLSGPLNLSTPVTVLDALRAALSQALAESEQNEAVLSSKITLALPFAVSDSYAAAQSKELRRLLGVIDVLQRKKEQLPIRNDWPLTSRTDGGKGTRFITRERGWKPAIKASR